MNKVLVNKKNGILMLKEGALLSEVVKGYVPDLTETESYILDKLELWDRADGAILTAGIFDSELISRFGMDNTLPPETILGAFNMLAFRKRPISHKQINNESRTKYVGGKIETVFKQTMYSVGLGGIYYGVSLSRYLAFCFYDEPGDGEIDDQIIDDDLEFFNIYDC